MSDEERHQAPSEMSADEMIALTRKHTMFSWVAQHAAEPIAMDTAKGSWFTSVDGKRYLDFNSQAMSVNIGHGDERVADAIAPRLASWHTPTRTRLTSPEHASVSVWPA